MSQPSKLLERAVTVYAHGCVKYAPGDAQAGDSVHNGREGPCQRAHEVGVGKDDVAELRLGVLILDAGCLDKVRHVYAGGTCDFAPFAVHAVLECIIEEVGVLEAETFTVRAGLLGARIQGIHCKYGAICGAHRTLGAFLKIIGAAGIFL